MRARNAARAELQRERAAERALERRGERIARETGSGDDDSARADTADVEIQVATLYIIRPAESAVAARCNYAVQRSERSAPTR